MGRKANKMHAEKAEQQREAQEVLKGGEETPKPEETKQETKQEPEPVAPVLQLHEGGRAKRNVALRTLDAAARGGKYVGFVVLGVGLRVKRGTDQLAREGEDYWRSR